MAASKDKAGKACILQLTDERIDNSSESQEKGADHSQRHQTRGRYGRIKEIDSETSNDLESNAQGNSIQKALRRNKAKKKKSGATQYRPVPATRNY